MFTSYTKDPFGKNEQQKLADIFFELVKKECHVILSNADTTWIRKCYENSSCTIEEISTTRPINSKASDRNDKVSEVIVVGKLR